LLQYYTTFEDFKVNIEMQNRININYKGKTFSLLDALIVGKNKISRKL